MKKINMKKYFIWIIVIIIILTVNIVNYNSKVVGKIYFNKPVSWENAYVYMCDENGEELLGEWPGRELFIEEDYICCFELTNKIVNNEKIYNYEIEFNDGSEYTVKEKYVGYNKIYNITNGIGEKSNITVGEWLDYSKDLKIGKIPTTKSKIKNVIYMIGDGMGENHIIAGGIYKNQILNIQTIPNKTYIKTASLSTVTDSAAGATALATGYKTSNGMIGKDKNGANVENLIEYANSKQMKTGIVCTQVLNHATPAGFYVHNAYRYNYNEIVQSQITGSIDLMLGGGRKYFSIYENEMIKNNYKWINDFSELKNSSKEQRIIGTFAEESIAKEENRISLSEMTKEAISRLENSNGFFLMIEGSDIDTYSHESDMDKMLVEMIQFDDAVGIAMSYVNTHQDTLLIVTADHETGGLKTDGITSKEELTNALFTSNGQHTDADVPIYAYGAGAYDISKYDIIDNTSIYKFIKQGLKNNYK